MASVPQVDGDYRARIYERYAQNFQDAGATFDAAAAARWGKPYSHYFRGWLPCRDAQMVDLACGGGRLLYFFRQSGYANLTGVDISPDQVALSRQVTNNIVQRDVLEFLADHPASFDLISGLDIVEHFHKPEVLRFLDGCHRALRPGGRLILQTPNAESPWGSVYRYGDFTHEVGFSPHSLSRVMALCGFRQIEARECGPVLLGHSVASFVRGLGWGAIRGLLSMWNLIEIGNRGSGVFTRVFLMSGVRPHGS